ncbi:hypothetical protein MASR2M29_11610 [Spirochaetota bacterium]
MIQNEYVFILYTEKPLVLHPFLLDRYKTASGQVFLGRCVSGFNPVLAETIRKDLYLAAEYRLQKSIVDKAYALRLAATALVFLVVYLFFSIVVRDPIPFIDEFLLGSIAAAFVYIRMGQKAKKSPRYLESIMDSRRIIDSIYFTESPVLDLFEAWLKEFKSSGVSGFYKPLDTAAAFSASERQEAEALCEFLSQRFKKRSIIADIYKATMDGRPLSAMLNQAWKQLGNVEASLAFAYLRLLSFIIEKDAVR